MILFVFLSVLLMECRFVIVNVTRGFRLEIDRFANVESTDRLREDRSMLRGWARVNHHLAEFNRSIDSSENTVAWGSRDQLACGLSADYRERFPLTEALVVVTFRRVKAVDSHSTARHNQCEPRATRHRPRS